MFSSRSRVLVLCSITAMASACAPGAPPGLTEADRAAIQATTNEALAIANGSRDWEQYVAVYYAPDAAVLPSNVEVLRGREALVAFFANYPPFEDLQFTEVEVDGAGDLAYVYGTYSLTLTLPGMEPEPDRGKYIEIWRRQADGSWKVALDIFNSDLPLPEG